MGGPAGKRVVSPVMVGRGEELELLVETVSAAPAVVAVEGEPGVGKTRLVSEAAAGLRQRGWRLLTGGCRRIRDPFPLGPVIDALRGVRADLPAAGLSPVAGALHSLLPELATVLPPEPTPVADPVADRHRVFRALVEVLSALEPVVLILENLHWADGQTADFLSYLAGQGLPGGLAVVATMRPAETDPELRELLANLPPGVASARVVLAPLRRPDIAELTAAILGADRIPEELTTHLWRRTSGLPFAVEELLALLLARGDVRVDRGVPRVRATLAERDVPDRIRDQVRQRVARLSAPARAVVEAAAVLQMPAPTSVLAATVGEPVDDGLASALSANVLVESAAGIGFRHLLGAQAVYDGLAGSRRGRLHAQAAAALLAATDPPLGQVAHHLRHSGQLLAWVEVAERAADRAFELGHVAEAARLLEDLLRHADLPASRRGELAVKLGEAACRTVRVTPGIIDLLAGALGQELPAPLRGELSFLRYVLLNSAAVDFGEQRQLLAGAVVDLAHRPEYLAHAMVALGFPAVPGVPPQEARKWLHRALDTVPAVGDPASQLLLLGKIAMVLAVLGDPRWRSLADVVVQRTGGEPTNRKEIVAYQSISDSAGLVGDLATADRLLAAETIGNAAYQSPELHLRSLARQALLDYCRGHWDGLSTRADLLIERLADFGGGRLQAELVVGCLALPSGELPEAERRLVEVVERAERAGMYDLLPIPMAALLRLLAARGDGPAAGERAGRFVSAIEELALYPSGVRALPAVVEALLVAGQEESARARVVGFRRRLRTLDAPLASPALRHARGLLAADGRRWGPGVRHFTEAAQRYEARECPYEAAQARERAAMAMFAGGLSGSLASESLREALASYRRLGASWDYSRAARAARRFGVVVPPRHRGGRRGYAGQLSPREREVATLAAGGLTNQAIASELFISANTVKKQLAAAMRKLAVHSRGELADRLAAAP